MREVFDRAGEPIRRQRHRLLRAGARGGLVHRLRDHAAPGRSLEARPSPARAVPVSRDRRGARRRHRHPRGADDRHVGGHRRLALPELDRAPAARRRGLRDLGRDAAQRGRPAHLPATSVRLAHDEHVRLPAVLALRRVRQPRRARRRARSPGSTSSSIAISGSSAPSSTRPGRTCWRTTRRSCASSSRWSSRRVSRSNSPTPTGSRRSRRSRPRSVARSRPSAPHSTRSSSARSSARSCGAIWPCRRHGSSTRP